MERYFSSTAIRNLYVIKKIKSERGHKKERAIYNQKHENTQTHSKRIHSVGGRANESKGMSIQAGDSTIFELLSKKRTGSDECRELQTEPQ